MTIRVVNRHTHAPTPHDVYIGRGSKFGNPFRIPADGDRDTVCRKFEELFNDAVEAQDESLLQPLRKLYAQWKHNGELTLVCFCAPQRCHGETIKRFLESA